MVDFLERLRAKPEHERKRIAVGTATAVTGLIAFGWVTALASGGILTLRSDPASSEIADTTGGIRTGFSELLGAAGAAAVTKPEAGLTIIDEGLSTSIPAMAPAPETRTVIPF